MRFSAIRTIALSIVLAALVPTAAALAQTVETVRVGQQIKNVHGTVLRIENGDAACYLTLRDDRGATFKELADFGVCEKPGSLLNKRVALKYQLQSVQSPECQGDEKCRKTVTVALITQAQPVAAAGSTGARTAWCSSSETIVFSCHGGQKLVSVCAPKDAGPRRGYLEYRFGDPAGDTPEMVLPKDRLVPAKAARGSHDPFAGGGGAWLSFRLGQTSYTVYTGIGNWGPKGEKREKAGLLVERSGKQVSLLKCAGKYWSELGPDLFEKLGIDAGDATFDYPD